MTAIASGCCICAGPESHRQRHQAQDRAEARHQDRPEPRPPGLQQGLMERHSLVAQLADVLDQDDPVLHVQADQQDGPHERRDVQWSARHPEGEDALASDTGWARKMRIGSDKLWNWNPRRRKTSAAETMRTVSRLANDSCCAR